VLEFIILKERVKLEKTKTLNTSRISESKFKKSDEDYYLYTNRQVKSDN
jgi:hypothetical protein